MIALPTYSGETAIFGLGRSGLAAVAALRAAANRVVVWDDAKAPRARAAELGADIRDLTQDFGSAERLIVSPGVPLTHPEPHGVIAAARAANAEIWGDLDLFADALAYGDLREAVTLIGITGTNGKSTTTSLVTHMLETAGHKPYQGGNIGTPVLELPLEKGAAYVLELSSYQLDLNRRFGVDIGVWLNLTPDHLDRHGDMAGYAAAKAQLFADGKAAHARIVGIDDAHMRALADNLAQDGLPLVTLGAQNADLIYLANAFIDGSENISLAGCAALPGAHNAQNAAAAFAVGQNIGLTQKQILAAFRSFGGMPHRLQIIADYQAIKFVNDSKATNVNAVYFALESMISPTVWIVGGIDKGNDYSLLYPLVREKVKAIVCLGVDNQKIIDSFNSFVDLILETQSMKEAVMIAHKIADKNENVLLSPACASFDLFKNFEDRGMQFKKAVREL